jgi:hypothetical protein
LPDTLCADPKLFTNLEKRLALVASLDDAAVFVRESAKIGLGDRL